AAVAAGGAHGPALLVGRRFDHDCLAIADALGEHGPETVADAGAGVADEDARCDFDHPAGQVAAQALGCGDEDDDGHQGGGCSSTSGPVTPTIVLSSHWSARSAAQLTPPGTWPSTSSHRCRASSSISGDPSSSRRSLMSWTILAIRRPSATL